MSREVYVFTPAGFEGFGTDWDLMRRVAIVHRSNRLEVVYFDVNKRFKGLSPVPSINCAYPPNTVRYCRTNTDGPILVRMAESPADFFDELVIGGGKEFSKVAYVNRNDNDSIVTLVDSLAVNDFDTRWVKF